MKVAGEFTPPLMGYQHESFPISGTGALEVVDGELRLEGSRGFPWEVKLLGTLGFFAGCVLAVVMHMYLDLRKSAVLGILGGLIAGTAAGYALSRRRDRATETIVIPFDRVVSVTGDDETIQVMVKIRRRWQNRKQIVFFHPADRAQSAGLVAALNKR
jgi:hypothetical protein